MTNSTARTKSLLIALAAVLLLSSLVAKHILSVAQLPPSGIPKNWKPHKEIQGRFEVWLPEEWAHLGVIRTVGRRLRDTVEGVDFPLLFVAYASGVDGYPESIFVQDYDAEFENYDPLFREDVAKACTRLNPVLVTDPSSGESTPSELLTGTLVLEQERGRTIVAYQSYLMGQKLNRDLVRTSACAVSEDHVYSIILSTTEELDSPDTPTYEKVLKVFVVLK
jgi:hypothetical protein